MNEHANPAGLSDVTVAQAKKQRNKLITEIRSNWFVRIFQPTLMTLIQEPKLITIFFYFCSRLIRLSEPKRPVDWITATRSEIAEAIRPEKTRKGRKRRANDPEQAVTNSLKSCFTHNLLERHPDDPTRYRIPGTAAQFGQTERLKVLVNFASVRGRFLDEMDSVWLHRPHALRVVTVLLRRMADRHGKGHNWYSATEEDWMVAVKGGAKPNKSTRPTSKKNSARKKTKTKNGKASKPKGMTPRLLRMAVKQLQEGEVLSVHRNGRQSFYQIPIQLASAVNEKTKHSFHPQRQKTLIP